MYDPKQLMMRGTQGNYDYQVFARRGKQALGFKFYGFQNHGHGNSLIGLKLRAARTLTMESPLPDPEVVKLEDAKVDYREAWPKFEWSQADGTRTSTNVTVIEEGGPGKEPLALAARLKDGSVAEKFVDFLFAGLNSEDELVLRRKQVKACLQEHLVKGAAALEKAAAALKDGGPANPTLGVVGTHQASIKKLFSQDDVAEMEAAEDSEEGDEGDE